MTSAAPHVLVRALQGKRRLLVIDKRWPPLGSCVAVRAVRDTGRDTARLHKLRSVYVLVTVFTLRRCRVIVDIGELALQVRRLVAARALHCLVRARQLELRIVMVEVRQFRPGLRRVAAFTSRRLSRGTNQLHPGGKLSLVRIVVAGRAA